MSNSYSEKVQYSCSQDCVATGCPSHEIHIWFHHTASIVNFMKDGEVVHSFFPDELVAYFKLWKAITKDGCYDEGE